MALLALLTEKHEFIDGYMNRLGDRLRSPNWISGPFAGSLHAYNMKKERLWVIEVAPIYPRYVFNVILGFLLVAAVTVGYLGFPHLSNWTYAFTVLGALFVNLFWTSWFYEWLIRVQLWRLLKRRVKVARADSLALRWLAHGKV